MWGAIETLKFVVVTIGVSNIIAFGLNWIEYFVLRNPVFLYVSMAPFASVMLIRIVVQVWSMVPWPDGATDWNARGVHATHT